MAETSGIVPALVAFQAALPRVEKTSTANTGTFGYCLDPATPVLTADLIWTQIGDVEIGDRLVAFDEHRPGRQRARRWAQATVTANDLIVRPCYRIVLADGTEFVASQDHPWLAVTRHYHGFTWIETQRLRVGDRLLRVTDTWNYQATWETGYLAAAFDGEGSLTQTPLKHHRGGGARHQAHLMFSQRDNVMLETVDKIAGSMGFVFGRYSTAGRTVQTRRLIGGRAEMLRFLGAIRPERLRAKLDVDRLGDMRAINRIPIESVEFIGPAEVAALATSTGTFVASGFASHNSYADLAEVSAVVLPRLAQHGLAYVCELRTEDDGRLVLDAQLRHTSGEWFRCRWPVPLGGSQQMGSAITYGRRYCLLALCGVHPVGEDDDAQEAQKAHDKLARETVKAPRKATRSSGKQPDDEWTVTHTPPPGGTGPPRPKGSDIRSAEQSTAIFATLGDLGMAHDHDGARALIARLAGWDTPKSTKELTRAEAGAVIDALADIHSQADPQAAIAAILGEQEQLL